MVKSVDTVLVAISSQSSVQAIDALYYFGGKSVETTTTIFEDKGEHQGEEEGGNTLETCVTSQSHKRGSEC